MTKLSRPVFATVLFSAIVGVATNSAFAQTITGFTAGNATYSTITVTGDPVIATAVTDDFGNSSITFTHSGTPTWTGTSNSVITYSVTFTNPVDFVQLDFNATAFGPSFLSAIADVGETVSFTGPSTLGHPSTQYDLNVDTLPTPIDGVYVAGDGSEQLSNFLALPFPVTTLNIIKSIDVAANGGTASISSVDNLYTPSGGAPSPEPASLGLLTLGSSLLLTRRRVR